MAGYPYDSTYLLREMLRLVGRPQPSDAVSRGSYFERLTDAQNQVVADIAGFCPDSLYSPTLYTLLPVVSTTLNNKFLFGVSQNGFDLAPIGRVKIYRNPVDVPDYPMQPGVDYNRINATEIQLPNEQQYTGTLYWRGIVPPGPIDDTTFHEPVLFPEASRQLIAYRAAINFLMEGGRDLELANQYKADYGRPLTATPGMFATWLLVWRTQFVGGGALGPVTGRRLAIAGQ